MTSEVIDRAFEDANHACTFNFFGALA